MGKYRTENEQLTCISVDVQIQPNGKFDLYLSDEGGCGAHYNNVTADQIGEHVADLVACYAEAYDQ